MNEDLISRSALSEKLQVHHNFFVNAWGGFSNLPTKDKARVDEITNCIAEVMNAPAVDAVEVVHGRWKEMHYEGGILDGTNFDRCSVCGYERVFNDPALKTVFKYCPNCGAKMDLEG